MNTKGMNATGSEQKCVAASEPAFIEHRITRLDEATERNYNLVMAIHGVLENTDVDKGGPPQEPVNYYLPDRMERVALQVEETNAVLDNMLVGLRGSLGALKII